MNPPPATESGRLDLPPPDADAIALSSRLADKIVARIEQRGGVIGFDEYMQMALYEPGHGYYVGGRTKFGAAGDFVTAPEISPLFGECLAAQAARLMEQGCAAAILEFGAGSGRLCAQILEALPLLERYSILDMGAELGQRQREYLQSRLSADRFARIEWLSELPQAFDGIVLANEVLDAMPVHLIEKQGGWHERGVAHDEGFVWKPRPPDNRVRAAIERLEDELGEFADGYRSEVNLNYGPWINALAQSCARVVVMIIDYGYERAQYYHPARREGSLICHYRHRVHDDPLIYPGLQDITAFVDFDAVADAAETAGFEICGLARQGEFLLANGLLEMADRRGEAAAGLEARGKLAQQVKTLTLPQEMGERFKVLALQKGLRVELPALRPGAVHG